MKGCHEVLAKPREEAVTDHRLLQRGITRIRYEYSYGIIGYRIKSRIPTYLMIQHRGKGREWGFPKGHYQKNENLNGHDTAKREFEEETGLEFGRRNVLSVDWNHPHVSQYEFIRGQSNGQRLHKKWTVLFAAEISDIAKPTIVRPQEIAQVRWMTRQEFEEKNKHKEYRDILHALDSKLVHIINCLSFQSKR